MTNGPGLSLFGSGNTNPISNTGYTRTGNAGGGESLIPAGAGGSSDSFTPSGGLAVGTPGVVGFGNLNPGTLHPTTVAMLSLAPNQYPQN